MRWNAATVSSRCVTVAPRVNDFSSSRLLLSSFFIQSHISISLSISRLDSLCTDRAVKGAILMESDPFSISHFPSNHTSISHLESAAHHWTINSTTTREQKKLYCSKLTHFSSSHYQVTLTFFVLFNYLACPVREESHQRKREKLFLRPEVHARSLVAWHSAGTIWASLTILSTLLVTWSVVNGNTISDLLGAETPHH